MKKIAIIGASDLQNPLILKAKEMGYETHVFAWQDGSIGEKTADVFYPISIIEKNRILEKCREINPMAITTIASDLANITVNYVARNMNLTTNTERSILISTNKFEMRKAFKSAGLPTPLFYKIGAEDSLTDIYNMKLPIIVKPTDRSGSRSITKLTSFDGLNEAIEKAINDSFEKKAIIEEYIEGNEYSFECISFNGEHHFLAVTKKYTTGSPHFIETGHIQPSDLNEETVDRVKKIIFKALDALEIKYGASHSEFKVDKNGNINIIEIGSRMGGDCIGSDLVKLSTGYDFVRMVIQTSLGQKPSFEKVCKPCAAGIRFIMSHDDMLIYERIKKEKPNLIYRSSEMKKVNAQVVDSSSRFGFYIIKSDDRKELLSILEM